jgi:hypothetical protein
MFFGELIRVVNKLKTVNPILLKNESTLLQLEKQKTSNPSALQQRN